MSVEIAATAERKSYKKICFSSNATRLPRVVEELDKDYRESEMTVVFEIKADDGYACKATRIFLQRIEKKYGKRPKAVLIFPIEYLGAFSASELLDTGCDIQFSRGGEANV